MKSWLQDNNKKIYSVNIKEESVILERSIRTLKSKIYKYITSISKNMHIDKLNIVNRYNNIYRVIRIKPIDVKSSSYIDFDVENNNKDPKIKVCDHVRTSKHRNIFAKVYTPN